MAGIFPIEPPSSTGEWRVNTYPAYSFSDGAAPTRSLGQILSVRGSEARVALPAPVLSEQFRATVGTFLRISAGPSAG